MAAARIGSPLKIIVFGLTLAALSPAFSVFPAFSVLAEEDTLPSGSDDTLRIPGLPPHQDAARTARLRRHRIDVRAASTGAIGFPPTVIGPGGVVRPFPQPEEARRPPPRPALTPEQRADRIRKALVPKPSLAVVRRHTLDDLYAKLSSAKDVDEAKGLATLIGGIWLRSGSDTANLLMQRALTSIDKKTYPVALDLLDRLIELQPGWAEAWNKRASVRFYQGNLDGAMADVEHVLKLEPNHFGAIDGMGAILQRTGFDRKALEVYRRSLAIYPHQPEVEKIVEKLQLEVDGQGI